MWISEHQGLSASDQTSVEEFHISYFIFYKNEIKSSKVSTSQNDQYADTILKLLFFLFESKHLPPWWNTYLCSLIWRPKYLPMMAYYVVIWVLGKVSRKKLLFFWILSKLPPPPTIWTTCTTFFFERQKRWFKWHSKWPIIQNSSWIKAKYLPCESWIKPKKQFKVQIIGLLEEIDSFYWPKMHLNEKVPKNWTVPPLVWTKSKRTEVFPRETVRKLPLICAKYSYLRI